MNNWKLKYLGEQLQKSINKKYQLIITGLFLFDKDLYHYQPKTEFSINDYRIDLYYESINVAIEIDEPFHTKNKEDDNIRENNIRKAIEGIKFYRIDISKSDWHGQYAKIKQEILSLRTSEWNESDIVDGFQKITSIDTKKIGEQIISVSKYIFSNSATSTTTPRYRGVYINEGNNTTGNYYVAVVCYDKDTKKEGSKVSFVVYDEDILKDPINLISKNEWKKTKRTIDCLIKYLDIDEKYISSTKEDQFKTLKRFICKQFDEIDSKSLKIKKKMQKTQYSKQREHY